MAEPLELEGQPTRSRLGELYLAHADGALRLAYLLTANRLRIPPPLVGRAGQYLPVSDGST
jgi:hypothetical protein